MGRIDCKSPATVYGNLSKFDFTEVELLYCFDVIATSICNFSENGYHCQLQETFQALAVQGRFSSRSANPGSALLTAEQLPYPELNEMHSQQQQHNAAVAYSTTNDISIKLAQLFLQNKQTTKTTLKLTGSKLQQQVAVQLKHGKTRGHVLQLHSFYRRTSVCPFVCPSVCNVGVTCSYTCKMEIFTIFTTFTWLYIRGSTFVEYSNFEQSIIASTKDGKSVSYVRYYKEFVYCFELLFQHSFLIYALNNYQT